ncbi:pescadillo-like isoform X1 [Limulus polyphemus]|uniref:Pescadillo homolog n=1 Tax=Limulus polyphemus TaxID=6850 RepID=A0ABM1S0Q3_LIMPO|nr:pescadillo-like isoform X1 [Limulus polyphemus]
MARKPKKKGESGAATTYISRKQALKKLQLSLKDFRRLCILKGIYPVEPNNKKAVNKGSSVPRTFYYLKDIQFLAHEPVILKFRDFKVFIKKLRKAIAKNNPDTAQKLRNNQPLYKLDHIVKERYPTFIDAIRDLDDAISMCFLFATFPKSRIIHAELVHLCKRLTVEFMHYVIESKSLRKVFISIKGYYYQAEIMGQLVTWIVPHPLSYCHPSDVDFKIMITFTEFYTTMLGFVNFKLFHSINLYYPPKLQEDLALEDDSELFDRDDLMSEAVAALNHSLKSVVKDSEEEEPQFDEFPQQEDQEKMDLAQKEQVKIQKLQKLFKGLRFFLNREVPRESLVFIIKAFDGEVSWDKTLFVGATYDESDETITHQIVDRPNVNKQYINRYYIQPQWVYDSINACMLLPVEDYFPGEILPPHLSPFVEEKEGDYIPPEKQALLDMQKGLKKDIRQKQVDSENEEEKSDEEQNSSEENSEVDNEELTKPGKRKSSSVIIDEEAEKKPKMTVKAGQFEPEDINAAERQGREERKLVEMMIPKKKKRLYDKIMYGQRRKSREAEHLKVKRAEFDRNQKLEKRLSRGK